MKSFLFFLSLLLYINHFTACAQNIDFGAKLGLNYTVGNYDSEIFIGNGRYTAKADVGFLVGGFMEVKLQKFLLRPEVYYSKTNAEFDFPQQTIEYNVQKISFPLLFGYNIAGPVDIYAGPAYQHILDSDLQKVVGDFDSEQSNWAGHFGLKFIYPRWELDLRYEYVQPTKDNQNIRIDGLESRANFDEGRLNNLMLSLSYKFL